MAEVDSTLAQVDPSWPKLAPSEPQLGPKLAPCWPMFAQVGPESATKAFWAEIHQVEDRWCISMSKPECPGGLFENVHAWFAAKAAFAGCHESPACVGRDILNK